MDLGFRLGLGYFGGVGFRVLGWGTSGVWVLRQGFGYFGCFGFGVETVHQPRGGTAGPCKTDSTVPATRNRLLLAKLNSTFVAFTVWNCFNLEFWTRQSLFSAG